MTRPLPPALSTLLAQAEKVAATDIQLVDDRAMRWVARVVRAGRVVQEIAVSIQDVVQLEAGNGMRFGSGDRQATIRTLPRDENAGPYAPGNRLIWIKVLPSVDQLPPIPESIKHAFRSVGDCDDES